MNSKYFLPGIKEYSSQSYSKKTDDDETLIGETPSLVDNSSTQEPLKSEDPVSSVQKTNK